MGKIKEYLRQPVLRAYAVAMAAAASRPITPDDMNWHLADNLVRAIADSEGQNRRFFLDYQKALEALRGDPTLSSRNYALYCSTCGIAYLTVLADRVWAAFMRQETHGAFDLQGEGRRRFRAAFSGALVEHLWGQISSPKIDRDRDLFESFRLTLASPDAVGRECSSLAMALVGNPFSGVPPSNPSLLLAFNTAFAHDAAEPSLLNDMERAHRPIKALIDDLLGRRPKRPPLP